MSSMTCKTKNAKLANPL